MEVGVVSKYQIILKGKLLALAYVSPHPVSGRHIIASVVPIERTGEWEDNSLEVHFKSAMSELFPSDMPHHNAIRELLHRIGIQEPYMIGQVS